MNLYTILIVESEVSLHIKTFNALSESFSSIKVVKSIAEAEDSLQETNFDLVLINLDNNDSDAITITKDIRAIQRIEQPYVVIYTKKNDDFLHELLYSAGADAVINFFDKKNILVPYLKNLLNRKSTKHSKRNSNFEINEEEFVVYYNNEGFALPKKEFYILKLLFNNSHKYFTKSELASLIWADEAVAEQRTVDVHIYNIRKKIAKNIIQTKKNSGYKFNEKIALV